MPDRGCCSPSRAGRLSANSETRLRAKAEYRLGAYENFSVDDARRYHAATYSIGMGAARLFSRSVDLAGRKLLLDLGGGSGAYSITATKAWSGLKAIVFDLPAGRRGGPRIYRSQRRRRPRECGGRRFHPRRLSRGVDVVVMASNLPQYEPALIKLVVGKASRRTRAGRRDASDRRDAGRRSQRSFVGHSFGVSTKPFRAAPAWRTPSPR